MCELFGVSSPVPCELNNYLKIFYKHSTEHPHGWGIALFDNDKTFIKKSPERAIDSSYLKNKLNNEIITAKTALGHIRYATIGNISPLNCHPYRKKDNKNKMWTLVHNGTIFDFPALNKYLSVQLGETDSERILLYIIDQINKKQKFLKRRLEQEELFSLMNQIVIDISTGNKVNLLIYDGEFTYVHTNYKNTLYMLEKKGSVYFSTTKLTDENWINVPFTRLLVFKEGKLVFTGTNHGHEYFDKEENNKTLYQVFSGL